ncbi:MAG: Flp pilus assembly complex ATPase component TadA [Proteobacteria bacterium]|nr:Flp pilus assembly complex ATPase component TadA [Pseudomonadota bacterium]
MYQSHYGLSKKPFQLNTDPAFLWLGEKHKEALATLKYGVIDQKGFLLVSGDVGTGKTTLINALLKEIGNDTLVANISDPALDIIEFFNLIAISFNIPVRFNSKIDFIDYFSHFLKQVYAENKNVLLIIDESHSLSKDVLEHIRLLSNIELPEEKLINIFFVGQNEIHETLSLPECRALRQRISLVYHIEPLSEKETLEYIRHRLKVAGTTKSIFNPSGVRAIHHFSKGYPRLINTICDHALLAGYVKNLNIIGPDIINECAMQFDSINKMPTDNHSMAQVEPFPIEQSDFFLALSSMFRKKPYVWVVALCSAAMLFFMTAFYQNALTTKENSTEMNALAPKTAASSSEKSEDHSISEEVVIPPPSVRVNQTVTPSLIEQAKKALDTKDFDRAIVLFEQVLAENPMDMAFIKMSYSRALQGQAARIFNINPDVAESLLSKAVEVDDQNAEAHFNLGRIYTKSNDYSNALKAYQTAANLNYRSPDTFYNLGFIYASIKDYEQAEKMFLHVVDLNPSYLDKVFFNLAVVQQKQGKRQQCLESLEKAVKSNPNNQRAEQFLSQLKP